MLEDKELSLREVAYLCGLSVEEAESDVCDCDLLNGWVCDYHENPDVKHTLAKWQEMSTRGDQYGTYQYTRFFPINDIEGCPEKAPVLERKPNK